MTEVKSKIFEKLPKPGIRGKLALFTGSLVCVTVGVLSYTAVRQQTAMLTESYEKQAAISRRYISELVVELNSIAQNLVKLEEFRKQIAEQTKAARAYRTTHTVEEEKQLDLGLFKTSLFGVLGKKQVRHVRETFFSRYLSGQELAQLENRIRRQLSDSAGRAISTGEWSTLQALARKLIAANEAQAIFKLRSQLDRKIAEILVPARKKIIEETGLEKKLFRIQTFPITDLPEGQKPVSSFDTNLFGAEGPLAALEDTPAMEENLQRVYSLLAESPEQDLHPYAHSFSWHGLEIQTLYSPLFDRENSTFWAHILYQNAALFKTKTEFLHKDQELTAQIAQLVPRLKDCIKRLKAKKQAPNTDKEFRELYKTYNSVIKEREKFYLSLWPEKPDQPLDLVGEAVKFLRDIAWEDNILLRYSPRDKEMENYRNDSKARAAMQKRWQALRRWISDATSETPPEALKRLFVQGQISKSRSEAEELLWEFDARPLFRDQRPDLALVVLQSNLTGVMRILVDRTAGVSLVHSNRNKVLLSAALIGFVAIVFVFYISGVVVQKIKRIIRSAEEVGRGNLNVEFAHAGSDEFGTLTVALNHMVSGLREREKIKGILGTMIDPVVVSEAMKDLEALKRGSERVITAFFSDVASFSEISEKLTAPQLAALLNEYLSAMTIILKKYEGVLDKYIGDAIVGIFNSPVDVADHPFKAAMASIEMEQRLAELRSEWQRSNKYIPEAHQMRFRIGLNTGPAKVGFMGTDAIASYTMMGDTVNLAARLEAAAKDYGVSILATDAVYEHIRDRIFTRQLDRVRVKGKKKPVTLYQIICVKGKEKAQQAEAVHHFEKGLACYFNRNWSEAIALFRQSQKLQNGQDIAAELLIERCELYKQSPPPADWDGVFTRTKK